MNREVMGLADPEAGDAPEIVGRTGRDQDFALDPAHGKLRHGAADRLCGVARELQTVQGWSALRSGEVEAVQWLFRRAPERDQVRHYASLAKKRPEWAQTDCITGDRARRESVRRSR